jgi:hypothetical protein
MPTEKLSYSISAQVSNGPRIALEDALLADAYGKFSAVVVAGAANVEVALPWGAGGKANFLVIKPAQASALLSYKVNDDTSTNSYALDGPHVLIGSGAIKLMGAGPSTLFFSNTSAKDIAVEILIGGDATP